jgi:hypothetical protein
MTEQPIAAKQVLIGLYPEDIQQLDAWADELAKAGTWGGNISRSRMVRILIQERKQKQSPPTISPFSNPPQH